MEKNEQRQERPICRKMKFRGLDNRDCQGKLLIRSPSWYQFQRGGKMRRCKTEYIAGRGVETDCSDQMSAVPHLQACASKRKERKQEKEITWLFVTTMLTSNLKKIFTLLNSNRIPVHDVSASAKLLSLYHTGKSACKWFLLLIFLSTKTRQKHK